MVPISKNKGDEIFPLILGSRFASEKGYIFVPQGKELKKAWKTVGINLSRKLPKIQRDKELYKCKQWIENLPKRLNIKCLYNKNR